MRANFGYGQLRRKGGNYERGASWTSIVEIQHGSSKVMQRRHKNHVFLLILTFPTRRRYLQMTQISSGLSVDCLLVRKPGLPSRKYYCLGEDRGLHGTDQVTCRGKRFWDRFRKDLKKLTIYSCAQKVWFCRCECQWACAYLWFGNLDFLWFLGTGY
jgi:hypothetical protein